MPTRSIPGSCHASPPTAHPAGASSAAAPPPPRPPILGPSFLAACGSDKGGGTSTSASAPPDDGAPARARCASPTGPLTWPTDFVAGFQTTTGLTVDYKEDLNDNEQWFAKIKEPLSRKQDIGADLVVPTTVHGGSARSSSAGSTSSANHAHPEHEEPARRTCSKPKVDPGRKFTAPYMSGFVGLGLQQGRDRPGHQEHRRSVGSGVQGPGQPAVRHPGRPRHDHAVAGIFARRAHQGERPEGRRSGQGAEGQGADPPLHRQRLPRRPGGRQYRCRASIFGRRRAAAGRQPRPAVRRPRVRWRLRSSTPW